MTAEERREYNKEYRIKVMQDPVRRERHRANSRSWYRNLPYEKKVEYIKHQRELMEKRKAKQ